MKLSNNIIAVSEDIKYFLTKQGVSENKIKVISNAVDANISGYELKVRRQAIRSQLGIKDETFVVGYLGRLSSEKGVNFLIEAVGLLVSDNIPLKLLIVGDGDDRGVLEQQTKQLGIGRNVIFAGFQADAERWLPAFDLFVLPSLTEGTPMALLEAMAAWVPVVATSVGGVPKIVVDSENGVLIPPENSLAIGDAITSIYYDPAKRKRLVRSALETVKEKYDVNKWCRLIENVYKLL